MYITVRYGEKEEEIFNPNCKCVCLLNTIKDRCQLCEWNADVDLSDESGNLKNLNYFPNRYAADMLEEREKLILIKIDRRDSGESRFIPLLNDNETLTETFYTQLTSKPADQQSVKRSRSSKSRGTPTKELKSGSSKSKQAKPAAPARHNSKNKNM